jgi:site-specific DNA recombinase
VAELLTRDGIPSPAAHDPARNRHRDGRAWSKSAVRVILLNPRYTGRQVWNRQRRDEVLLDVDDVAVQAQMAVHAHRHIARKPRAATRPYVLSGLLWCASCRRRMQGSHNHGTAHYRCRFAAEYAVANVIDHPKSIYVRESVIVPALDRWLGRLFDPDNLDGTIAALATHAHADPAGDEASAARTEAARRKLADCDDRLARYRAALDGGADPVLVAGWPSEVLADRLAAGAQMAALASGGPSAPRSPDEVRRLIDSLGDVPKALSGADPTDKARLYTALGLTITYDATKRRIVVEARPDERCALARVGGGT